MILFFYGPNNYAARQKVTELKERYLKKAGSNFGLETIDVEKLGEEAAQLITTAITSVPFLAEHRLVVIQNILSNANVASAALKVLVHVPESTVVIFYQNSVDERTKLFKELVASSQATKFALISPSRLESWVVKAAQDLGAEINRTEAQFLIERVGADQWRLHNELVKLVNFDQKITKQTIEQLVEPGFEQTIFDLVEAISKGDLARSIDLYQGLRVSKAQPLYILSMIAWQLRNLLVVKAAAGTPQLQIAKEFKTSPFVINKARILAGHMSLSNLSKAYKVLQETDLILKSHNPGEDVVMRQLIFDVSGLLKAK
jgi:DNA polymerase-3 subunit delta